MDQILVSVCCPPQSEHIDIKIVANSHVRVTVRRRQKRPKIHFLRHTFLTARCYASVDISRRRMSVCLSVCHTPVLYQNG